MVNANAPIKTKFVEDNFKRIWNIGSQPQVVYGQTIMPGQSIKLRNDIIESISGKLAALQESGQIHIGASLPPDYVKAKGGRPKPRLPAGVHRGHGPTKEDVEEEETDEAPAPKVETEKKPTLDQATADIRKIEDDKFVDSLKNEGAPQVEQKITAKKEPPPAVKAPASTPVKPTLKAPSSESEKKPELRSGFTDKKED